MHSTGPSIPRVLIIGVGNLYRGDDAIGLIVAQHLQHVLGDAAEICTASREGAMLLERWKEAEAVILIDAVRSGATPGTIHRFDARQQAIPAVSCRSSTHAFSVAEAIELARALGQLPAHLVIYGIEGRNFATGVGLSPEVALSITETVERVRHEVAGWRSGKEEEDARTGSHR